MSQTTHERLQKGILKFIDLTLKTGSSSKGDAFDETVKSNLVDCLKGVCVEISSEVWAKQKIFSELRKRGLEKSFDFREFTPIEYNGKKITSFVVDKPNGSHQWPDLLVVHNGIGLPIEVKSCKTDTIVWNGGFPRENALYIFNCYGENQTTFF